MGMPGEQVIGIPWKKAIYKDMNLIFSYSSSAYSWNVVRSLLERGVVQTRSLITHREEFGNFKNAFESLSMDNSVKTVLFHKNS
ncbi:MAG: hypothetical protein E7224_06570 [Clostridiales bacterium]|nr:hypothetical protein [Clostridiales bacterium]